MIEVVDGDTIKVLVAGEKFTLRYIGIDTPEMSAVDGKAARSKMSRWWAVGRYAWSRTSRQPTRTAGCCATCGLAT